MAHKHTRMTEVVMYFLSGIPWERKPEVVTAIDDCLETARCGRVIGSGTSLFAGGGYAVELLISDQEKAEKAISKACRKMKVTDYELNWP